MFRADLGNLRAAVEKRLATMDVERVGARLWQGDVGLWKDDPATPEIRDRLGWLTCLDPMRAQAAALRGFAEEVRAAYDRVVLLGMGGSSLAPEVLWRSFGRSAGHPSLCVLDSTDPRQVAAAADGDLARTLFLVSSKSGTTLETDSLLRYFWQRVPKGEQFVAITDPGTVLERLARERGFRRTFSSPADVGGRYSALTYFGLVPAALLGLDPDVLLERGRSMSSACGPDTPASQSPGLWLGAVLGEAARAGRDKLTFVLAPEIAAFGLWAEQLVAESTGKEGRGILPVADEPLGTPQVYGDDRIFVAIGSLDASRNAALDALAAAGHPVVRFELGDRGDLGGEFFRWEFATAVAGAVLRIHAFDQPNVAESKRNTLAVLSHGESLAQAASAGEIAAMLERVRPGDYLAILAYLPSNPQHDARLAPIRARLRDRLRVATTLGYGPRYLHSTGQLHKGGPARGHFILLTETPDIDVPIPGEGYGFAALQAAQAEGDRRALESRRRPALRVEGVRNLEGGA